MKESRKVLLTLGLIALLVWFLRSNLAYKVTGKLNSSQTKYRDLIRDVAQANGYSNVSFLQGLALEESSLDPSAASSKTSYGLFQIFHAKNFSWLRWAGYTEADFKRLYDPMFNAILAIKIVRYFEGKGFVFPRDSDIYNVGETEWRKGKRNVDYRQKVIKYAEEFQSGLL